MNEENFDSENDYDSSEPTVTVNTFEQRLGFYIAGDVGGAYMNNSYPPLKWFVANLVKRTKPPIGIEAPEATAAIRPSGELMVRLVNNPTPIIPSQNLTHEDVLRDRENMTQLFCTPGSKSNPEHQNLIQRF